MSNSKNKKIQDVDLKERFSEISDEEIVSILIHREHFTAEAAELAIAEALKRKIIDSINDLDTDQFKPQPIPPKSFFPIAHMRKQNEFILKSMCRIFYGFGIVPLIYAFFNYKSNLFQSILAIVLGLAIITFSANLNKSKKPFWANLLLALNLPIMGIAIYKLSALGNIMIMDAVASALIVFIYLYISIYANKVSSILQEQ